MKNQLFNKRIPTILGIGLVLLGIALTTAIVQNQTGIRSNASNSEEPQNVKITNVSDNSFSITYQTDAATTGSVNYGQSKGLGNTELDDLDKENGNFSPKNIHSITIKKLSPDTKYYLVIISGQNTYLNNGVPFEISTGPSISSESASQTTIQGKIILPDGNPAYGTLVYLDTENSQILSTFVGKNGEFSFSLKSFRTLDLSSYFDTQENTVLKLLAINNSLKSTVLISENQSKSIPAITLSNDYEFTNTTAPVASKSAESLGFPKLIVKQGNLKPQILIPKKDQSFTDQKPQFRGTSLPNEKVEIAIHSDENIQTQVTADSNGNWTYKPPSNLSSGEHTITIKTRDSSGILTTIMQSFTIFAQDSQIPESATPTSIPTPTPTSLPSPTIAILSPTVALTPFPSPTIISQTSKGGLPPTGDSSISVLTIGGIAATITGVALFLLTLAIL